MLMWRTFLSSTIRYVAVPFRHKGGHSKTLLVVFVVLNCIVLVNAWLHDPLIGYDARDHVAYFIRLASGRLPGPAQSNEFFSPPLPYVFPAFLMRSGLTGWYGAAKSAQFLNALLSVGVTFWLLKICDLIKPGLALKASSLLLLAMLPVYYRTFAFVRGEPFVVFFATFVVYQALLVFVMDSRRKRHLLFLGCGLGLLALSRQWGLLLFPPLILWCGLLVVKGKNLVRLFTSLAAVLSLAALIGAWFYLGLAHNYGSAFAFNRQPEPDLAISNQPRSFYFGLSLDKLFSNPVPPSFRNQAIPVLYADTWGDYSEYFVLYGEDRRTDTFLDGGALLQASQLNPRPEWLETNRYQLVGYLSRVNIVSLIPTSIFLAGFLFGIARFWRWIRDEAITTENAALSLCMLMITFSLLGYFWFLVRYPGHNGDTIKATYLLQTFPFACVLAGSLLDRVRRSSTFMYGAMMTLLVLVFAHNLPVLFTRYVP